MCGQTGSSGHRCVGNHECMDTGTVMHAGTASLKTLRDSFLSCARGHSIEVCVIWAHSLVVFVLALGRVAEGSLREGEASTASSYKFLETAPSTFLTSNLDGISSVNTFWATEGAHQAISTPPGSDDPIKLMTLHCPAEFVDDIESSLIPAVIQDPDQEQFITSQSSIVMWPCPMSSPDSPQTLVNSGDHGLPLTSYVVPNPLYNTFG
jgi:hypothetical protein